AGIDGFTEALRAELWGTGIRISTLYPPPVDTPIYHYARAKLRVLPRPAPPVAHPIQAARAIAHLAQTGERSRFFGWARPLHWLNQLSFAAADLFLHHMAGFDYTDSPAGREVNLDLPTAAIPPTIRAGWI